MSKNAVLALVAVVLVLFLVFGLFSGKEPEVEITNVELVFDNFDTDNRRELGDGHWYAYASPNGAFVANRGNVRITNDDGLQIDESAMGAGVSDGQLNIVFDATRATSIHWAAVERPFFADRREVDLRGLKSVVVRGEFSGTVYITLLTGAYCMVSNPMWSWRVASSSVKPEMFSFELVAGEKFMSGNWGPDISKPEDLQTALSKAIGFGIALHTVENDYAEFSVDNIKLILEGDNVPAEFK